MSNMLDYFIHKKFSEGRYCPYCSNRHIVLYGRYNGKQRYKCKTCRRTFGDLTNTPLAMTHFPEKWPLFMEYTLKGMSLKACAKEFKISYVSLFYWRHKLLVALSITKTKGMTGRVELDNMYLKYSRKGEKTIPNRHEAKRVHDKSMNYFSIKSDKVCVLTVLDGFKNIFCGAVCQGHLFYQYVEETLGKLINKENTVSSSKPIFTLFLKKMHIKRCIKNLKDKSAAIEYIGNCLDWMGRFNGVATKYLNNYLSWYKFVSSIDFDETSFGVKIMIDTIISTNTLEGLT